MQENTLVFPVDVSDTGTTTDQSYRRYEEHLNKSVYVGEDHSLSLRNELALFRTKPKASGNFRGMAKSAAKLTQDIEVSGVDAATTLVAPAIAEISFSLPVGATAAQAMLVRQRIVAIVDHAVAMVRLHEGLEI